MGKKKREFVLVLGAHSDDFVIGAGGTIAEYSREGKRVLCVVFSYGELSHPWMKKEEVVKIREEEAHKAGKVLGCRVKYFGLKDQGVYEDYKNKGIENFGFMLCAVDEFIDCSRDIDRQENFLLVESCLYRKDILIPAETCTK